MQYQNRILLILFILMGYGLSAQPDLPTGEVEVIKNFDARLLDTEKLKIIPELPPLDTVTQRLIYNIPDKSITLEYLPPKIRPVALRATKVPPANKGYAKLGYGIPNSPYAEIGYRLFQDDKLEIGAYGKHHSANFKDIPHQRFSNSEVNVSGNLYLDEGVAVNGKIGFSRDELHFYGRPESEQNIPTREQIRQHFNLFDLGVKVFNSARTQGDINYEAGIDFYTLSDNYASSENAFDLRIGGTKWIDETHAASIFLRTDFTNFEDTAKQKLNNFFLQPSFTFHGEVFKVKLGLNLASHDDNYYFLPDIEASANILGSQLAAFVGAKGDLHKNSFKNLAAYNPFILSRQLLENNKYFHYYGGVRGNIRGINYSGQVGYKTTDNLALFLNDDPAIFNNIDGLYDPARFHVVYDSVNIFNIQITASADIMEGLNLLGTLSSNVFDTKNQDKAWHLPALEANFTAKYQVLNSDLSLRGELYIANGVPYLDENLNQDNLNALFDISAGAEYQISEMFGAFLDVNNLFANKRERWYRYPTYGINVLAGITAKF